MGAMEFAAKPEVKKFVTHVYFAPVPPYAFYHGEPDCSVYALEISATPSVVRGLYRINGEPHIFFTLKSYSDDIREQFAYDVWRQLAGHTIPYAVYSPSRGGMLMKLASDDEFAIPHRDVYVGAWRI